MTDQSQRTGYIAMPGKEEGGLYAIGNHRHPVFAEKSEAEEMAKRMKTPKYAAPRVVEVQYMDPRIGEAMLTLSNWRDTGELPDGFYEEMEYALRSDGS